MASVPAHTLYGTLAVQFHHPAHMAEGSRPAPPGGVEYVGRGKCQAKNDTCEAYPMKGGIFCVGHTKAADKALAEKAAE